MAGLLMSQSGLRGSKMIQNDQYNIFLTIWGHFGPIWTLLDNFRQNLIFLLQITLAKKRFSVLRQTVDLATPPLGKGTTMFSFQHCPDRGRAKSPFAICSYHNIKWSVKKSRPSPPRVLTYQAKYLDIAGLVSFTFNTYLGTS